ncbi:MAG TPA: sialate O-acetylesterase [Isosphaeraceae bacterium]
MSHELMLMLKRSGRLALALALALGVALIAGGVRPARADVTLPALFGHHMVLQQGQKDRVWGHADPGEEVTVRIADQEKSTQADRDGHWSVTLDPMKAGGPHTLTVRGKTTRTFDDVLVGEVWLCSGQSNMQWDVGAAKDAELETRAATYPRIRLISVPQVGTQEPQADFRGQWETCSPETAARFSAVGYFFGRQLHETLDVPIGLIDDSWGGSAAEAWVRRDLLEADARFQPLMERWTKIEQDFPRAQEAFQGRLAAWKEAAAQARSEGKQPPPQPQGPEAQMRGNARPGNIYNGVLKPTIGYGLRGVIWYQGESNASRAYQYRELFPLMIQSWRDEWGIGDFPFYWVQLADFMPEKPEPADSAWAELREAQTMTLAKLPNTGQAVIIDLGEGKDIHPRNKQDVAHRLARWALARDYGLDIAYRSPTYKGMVRDDNRVIVSFDHVGGGLNAFDVPEVRGFAVAAGDRHFVRAQARILAKDRVEVWSDEVSDPVAVRYAWADNPVCNLYSQEGLPATPFRTDDWPGVTAEAK